MKTTIRSLLQMFAFATVALVAASHASAQTDIRFSAKSIYNNAEPNNPSGRVIVYNLPATGTRPGYFGAVDAAFDVRSQIVTGTSPQSVAGYGIIMEIPGTGVTFNVTDPAVSGANNMSPVATGQNAGLSVILGETNVDGFLGSNQSLGVIGLHPTANANTSLANNDGLFRTPIRVAGGVTGNFSLNMALGGNTYSGFAQSNGTLLTATSGFPTGNNTIEVRQSRRGDTNGDILADSEDIPGFISALQNLGSYQASKPWLHVAYVTDFNQDGAVDSEDIPGLIAAFQGAPSPSAVPEPTSLALLSMGVVGLLAARFARRKA